MTTSRENHLGIDAMTAGSGATAFALCFYFKPDGLMARATAFVFPLPVKGLIASKYMLPTGIALVTASGAAIAQKVRREMKGFVQ